MSKNKHEKVSYVSIALILLALFAMLLVSGCGKQEKPIAPEATPEQHTEPESGDQNSDSASSSVKENFVVVSDTLSPVSTDGDEDLTCAGVSNDYFESWSHHLPQAATYQSDIDAYLVCTDAAEMNQGSHYAAYSIEDGELVPWSQHTFSKNYTIRGESVHAEFEYATHGDQVAVTYIPADWADNELRFIHDTSRGIDRVLLGFNLKLDDGSFLHYPVYVNLETGELTDFLAVMEQTSLHDALSQEIYNINFFENGNFVVKRSDHLFYYFDMKKKEIYNLEEVSGKPISHCSLLSNAVVCWNAQGDFWKINLENWEVKPLFATSHIEYAAGFGDEGEQGSSFALYRDDDLNLYIYDFIAEEYQALDEPDGWVINGEHCHPSDCGRKLYMIHSDREEDVTRSLLFDADTKAYLEIDARHPGFSLRGSIYQNKIVLISDSGKDFYFYELR